MSTRGINVKHILNSETHKHTHTHTQVLGVHEVDKIKELPHERGIFNFEVYYKCAGESLIRLPVSSTGLIKRGLTITSFMSFFKAA